MIAMLSNKIYKHFFLEFCRYFLLVLFTFSIIVWTVQAVNYLDLIVDDGHAVSIYLNYALLNIPKILTKFIPLSFLLSLFITILKFENENEFIILWTSGLNKIKVVNFFFKVALIVTIIHLFLASFLNPKFLNYSRSLIASSDLNYISSMIKSNQFNDTVEGLTIYVEEKDENDLLKNIFIRDDSQTLKALDSSDDSSNMTIYAEKGKIQNNESGSYLALDNGTIQTENNKNQIQSINFKKTNLLLKGMKTKSIVMPKIQETSSAILINCLFIESADHNLLNCPKKKSKIDTMAEINRRFGMPLYIPAISLLLSFLIISRSESKRKNFYKYFYFSLAFVSLIMAEILVRYSGKSLTYSYLYYLTPLCAIPIFYFMLLKKFHNENLKKNI
tara:strand:- start:754 stop:1920 length:1167 start_codon:yes stop_codon:yes gene_type:complete